MSDTKFSQLEKINLSSLSDSDLKALKAEVEKEVEAGVNKSASHLIRLLLEGLEILTEGKLTFPLAQNNLVRDIKLGVYSFEWVLRKAEKLESLVDLAYANTKLQTSADEKEINKLQISLLTDFWVNVVNA